MHARLPTVDSDFHAPLATRINTSSSAAGTSNYLAVLPLRVATRFVPSVDVRNRGVLKASRHARQTASTHHFAVVRIWNGDDCRELSVANARSFAAQLMAAAAYAENQNMQPEPLVAK